MSLQIEVDFSRYSQTTIHKYDIIACSLLHTMYNVIYKKVHQLKEQNPEKFSSLTEGYKQALLLHFKGLKNNNQMKKCIQQIHDQFTQEQGYSTFTFRQCINSIAMEFAPKDDFEGFEESKKLTLLKKVIIDVHRTFIEHIIKNRIAMIIDDRKQDRQKNVDILKTELMSILVLEREELLNKYYSIMVGADKNTISKNTAESLKTMVREAVRDKVIAERKYNKYKELVEAYKNEVEKLRSEIQQLKFNQMKQKVAVEKKERTSVLDLSMEGSEDSQDMENSEENEDSIELGPIEDEPDEPDEQPVEKKRQLQRTLPFISESSESSEEMHTPPPRPVIVPSAPKKSKSQSSDKSSKKIKLPELSESSDKESDDSETPKSPEHQEVQELQEPQEVVEPKLKESDIPEDDLFVPPQSSKSKKSKKKAQSAKSNQKSSKKGKAGDDESSSGNDFFL